MSKQEEEHQQSHSPEPEEIPGYKENGEKTPSKAGLRVRATTTATAATTARTR
jgi:hypothetical protein